MELLAQLEDKYKLPSGLLHAVMKQESGGNVNAVSPKGARGAFQFMPATAKQYGVDVNSLESSADGAARMYADLLKSHNGDVDKALASYNWGQGNVVRKGMENAPKETRDYIAKVKSEMDMEKPWEDFTPTQVASNDSMPWEDFTPKQKAESKPKTTKQTSGINRFAQGIKDPIDAGAQLLEKVLPESITEPMNRLNNKIAPYSGGIIAPVPKGGVDAMIKADAANYNAPEGIDWARLGGNVLSPANLAVASKFPQGVTIGQRVLSGAAAGGALGALSPVENGDFASEKLKQIGFGSGTGGVLPMVTGGISRIVNPKAANNANLALLKSEGVTPTIGQSLGGKANALEEKLQSVPIMGDMISSARKNASSQFETAAYNRALKPIGQELPKGLSGRDALIHTENTLKNSYDEVLNKIGAITPDEQFSSKVSSLESMVNKQVMPKAEKAKFASALNDVRQSIDENGVITSDAYKALESSLGTDARKLATSTNIYEGKISPAVKQLQAELRDMLGRQAGDSAKELKATNTAWANFKRVQDAASKLGAENGNFSPAQLQNSIKTMGKNKGQFARGNALMQDLGDAGKSILGNKVADSGTAGRLLLGGGALGSYLINPAIPAGLVGGAAMYTSPAQKFLGALATNRPELAKPIASAIKQSSPYLTPAALGLFNYQQ
jgi:hypothetical protein